MIDANLLSNIETASDAEGVIRALHSASQYWLNGERELAEDAEIAVRLLNRCDDFDAMLPGSRDVIDALAREAGLFPYIDENQPLRDEIAREAHRVPGLEGLIFHSEQRSVFTRLMSGGNVVLSAPTSFGKTLLVDALIAATQPSLVMIIVPTIALLEERRRALAIRFPDYQIITQSFQETSSENVILVGTQERILEREDVEKIDLFVIDEFYKLDLTNDNIRAKSLNLLLAKFIDIAEQVYLLGPSIETNPIENTDRQNFEFIKTQYSPVTADIIAVDPPGTDPDTLADLLRGHAQGSSLVYCRSPKSARTVARELIQRNFFSENEVLHQMADWLRKNYHEQWYVADALERGIGIHHGRIPRAIAHLMVELFNRGEIQILLCTSSLIEGVNTVAENVIIYDKYISIYKLDRFTYDNIKGRAGRMFQHFVGKVFIFNEAPEPVYEPLDIPLLKEKDRLTDEALLQLPVERLSERNLARRESILDRLEIPDDILQRYSKFGVQQVEKVFLELTEYIESGDSSLIWSGLGSFLEVLRSMEVLWGRVEFDKHGVRSARQFAFFAHRLAVSDTIRDFLTYVAKDDDIDESIDLAFNFLKGAEYSFYDPLAMLNDMINAIYRGDENCDYGKFLSDMTSWGLPDNSKALEEIGVPAPIIQKVVDVIDTIDVDGAAGTIRTLVDQGEVLSQEDIAVLRYTMG